MDSSFVHVDRRSYQRKPDLIILAGSTGAPAAIQKILSQIPENCSAPILLLLHMPGNYSFSYAERLNQICRISVRQAKQGDKLTAGQALLCPGGMQMLIKANRGAANIHLRHRHDDEIYSPCIDTTLASVAKSYQQKVLAVILTGMGADGREGVRQLKKNGATVWVQDEQSCTIFGMPKAVIDANLADRVLSLNEIASQFNKMS